MCRRPAAPRCHPTSTPPATAPRPAHPTANTAPPTNTTIPNPTARRRGWCWRRAPVRSPRRAWWRPRPPWRPLRPAPFFVARTRRTTSRKAPSSAWEEVLVGAGRVLAGPLVELLPEVVAAPVHVQAQAAVLVLDL